jgi:hypothetical protein
MAAGRSRVSTARYRVTVALIGLAVVGMGCKTLQQRETNRRFASANRVVLDANSSPEDLMHARKEFSQVARDLTESRIDALAPGKRADAFAMRAYSEWRTGLLDDARISCRRAQIDPQVVSGSHADVMSRLLPGLIIASRETSRWNTGRRKLSSAYLKAYQENFLQALELVAQANERVASNTPEDTRAFVSFARWSIAADWRWVFLSVAKRDEDKTRRRLDAAERQMLAELGAEGLGLGLKAAVSALIEQIPEQSSLRALAEAMSASNAPPPVPKR